MQRRRKWRKRWKLASSWINMLKPWKFNGFIIIFVVWRSTFLFQNCDYNFILSSILFFIFPRKISIFYVISRSKSILFCWKIGKNSMSAILFKLGLQKWPKNWTEIYSVYSYIMIKIFRLFNTFHRKTIFGTTIFRNYRLGSEKVSSLQSESIFQKDKKDFASAGNVHCVRSEQWKSGGAKNLLFSLKK